MEITEQSSTKRQKLSNENMKASIIDRLNTLPDDVVCCILSFLPTKTSVSTCVLAKRWRLLWAHVPGLEFNECLHCKATTSISNIINRVMMRHKVQRLSSFRLYISSCCIYELDSWITTLADRDVQNLFINYTGLQVTLPPCLFSCKALVNLSLRYHVTIPMTATTVYLPSLKKLKLEMVRYESDESIYNCIRSCSIPWDYHSCDSHGDGHTIIKTQIDKGFAGKEAWGQCNLQTIITTVVIHESSS